jgi:hypothetical protein
MNEKRIAERPKVRWDTAQALKIARRAIQTMLREEDLTLQYQKRGIYGQSNN